ncbi:hypothetical protein BJ741DRAFT_692318 [Chytriomyces cf. hyalinus JEL632]|nr:hypothetical protein BJ741DRAFT_692318 [Chytriomyces cf. hyalinus JEL632]
MLKLFWTISKVFGPSDLTLQERGHYMELIIALRFIQGWWQDRDLNGFLPLWVRKLEMQIPARILDCRRNESGLNMYLQQQSNPTFPWVTRPPVDAGPHLQYSAFSGYVKTPTSQSTLYAAADDVQNLMEMDLVGRRENQPSIPPQFSNKPQTRRRVHMYFQLPGTPSPLNGHVESRPVGNDHVIHVSLKSDFALKFFGIKFVKAYKQFS